MDKVAHFYAPDRHAWRSWLEENHQNESGVWLVFDKGIDRTMTWQDIVKEALCFGWVDGRAGKVSDTQSKLYISKRKPKSVWSKINKQLVQDLTTNGLMKPSGMVSIEIAKQNGSWQALDLSDRLIHPPELADMFEVSPLAKRYFLAFPVSTQRNSLQWIHDAKTEETKLRRIKQVVEAAKENKRVR